MSQFRTVFNVALSSGVVIDHEHVVNLDLSVEDYTDEMTSFREYMEKMIKNRKNLTESILACGTWQIDARAVDAIQITCAVWDADTSVWETVEVPMP